MPGVAPKFRSLTLRYNAIGKDRDEAALALQSLCSALKGNTTLQRLDLRHNEIHGDLAVCRALSELIAENSGALTHLELSWNPLGPHCGEVLLGACHRNTTLLELQLSGCGLSDETLLEIATRLHRNRRAVRATLVHETKPEPLPRSLPEKPSWAPNSEIALSVQEWEEKYRTGGSKRASDVGDPGHAGSYEAPDLSVQERFPERSLFKNMIFEEPDLADLAHMPAPGVVSEAKTQLVMEKLLKWQRREDLSMGEKAKAQELFRYIEEAQKQLLLDQKAALDIQEHMHLLQQGFRDREERAKAEIRMRRHQVSELEMEKAELEQVFRNMARSLNRIREEHDALMHERHKDKEKWSAEEEADRTELARVMTHGRALRRRLQELQEQTLFLGQENKQKTERTKILREGIFKV